jgi:hypothetical protein
MAKKTPATVTVQNVVRPGSKRKVDARKYRAMKRAFLNVVPKAPPGVTREQILRRIAAHVPKTLFPKGAGVTWWSKTVQLDLEAKRIIRREKKPPVRLYRSR